MKEENKKIEMQNLQEMLNLKEALRVLEATLAEALNIDKTKEDPQAAHHSDQNLQLTTEVTEANKAS